MKRISNFSKRIYAAVVGLLVSGALIAQDNAGLKVIKDTNTAVSNLITDGIRLLQTILVLGGMVTVVMVIFKLFKGDREAAEKLAWWIAGLTLGFVLLSVLSGLVTK